MTTPPPPSWCDPCKNYVIYDDTSKTWVLHDTDGKLKLASIAQSLGIPWNHWPDLEISQFEVSARENHDAVLISITSWNAHECFTLKSLTAAVRRTSDSRLAQAWATLFLGSGADDDQRIELNGEYAQDADHTKWTLRTRIDEAWTLGDVGRLLLTPLGLDFPIPDLLDKLVFTAVELSLSLDLQNGAVTRKTLDLGLNLGASNTSWEIIPGLIEVAPRYVNISSANGRVTVFTQIWTEFCGVGWLVELTIPELRGSASMSTGDRTLGGLLEHFGLHDPGGLGDMKLASALLRFDRQLGLVSGYVSLSDVWKSEHFEIKGINIRIDYRTGQTGGVSASLEGVVQIDSVKLDVSAEHDGPGLGWQFSGSVVLTNALTIADLAKSLSMDASGLGPLLDIGLRALDLSYNTNSGALHVGCVAVWSTRATLRVSLDVQRGLPGTSKTVRFSGELEVSGARFDLLFRHDGHGDWLVGAYDSTGGGVLTLSGLADALGMGQVSGAPDVALRRVLLAWSRETITGTSGGKTLSTPSKMFVAADLDVNVDFSGLANIPVIGEYIGQDAHVGLGLRPNWSKGLAGESLTPLREMAPTHAAELPMEVKTDGLHLVSELRIGRDRFPLEFPTGHETTPTSSSGQASPPLNVVPVQRTLGGCLDLRQVKCGFTSPKITLDVDGSIHLGPVALDLIGLQLGYDIQTKEVSCGLHGLGLSLDKPPLRIEGSFLAVDGDFVGHARIDTAKFGLKAIGGFSIIGGAPSLFLYGVLDYPLGGPAFFFVEGLAAGFGLNRRLRLPLIEEVETFPLVQDAIAVNSTANTTANTSANAQMARLHDYIAPASGAAFFAAGIKFNSFKQLDGFGLAIVSIDTTSGNFELTLVGVADWSSPPKESSGPKLAWVRLLLLARLSSSDQSLILQAQLAPGSFVQSQNCHLRGGVAAGFWFGGDHAGDFVMSVGGYHPSFRPPAHYPVPPRVGIDWQISSDLHAGGSLYYALTPRELMFGFSFNAVWQVSPLRAWFDLSLDFLLRFKPLSFEGQGHIEIGASFRTWLFTVTVSAGASISIWGPPFGGDASAHLGPFSVNLSFGEPHAKPPPLSAAEFRKSFLPAIENDSLSVVPIAGLRTTMGSGANTVFAVNPKEVVLRVESLVPVDIDVTMPPMDETPTSGPTLRAGLTWNVKRDGGNASDLFKSSALQKSYPTAVWRPKDAPADASLAFADCGLTLRPKEPTKVGESISLTRAELSHDPRETTAKRGVLPRLYSSIPPRDRAARDVDRHTYGELVARPHAERDELLLQLSSALGDFDLDPGHFGVRAAETAEVLLDPPVLAYGETS